MPRSITVWKKVGETPLEATERARREHGISPETPLAYAGRLDPMADGLLLILVGEECKRQTSYHHLDKAYRFSVLFGFQSDTYDILGIASRAEPPSSEVLKTSLDLLRGTITLPYPLFSARTVRGIPLHERTLGKTLQPGEIPTKTSTVYLLQQTGERTFDATTLHQTIRERIDSFPEVTDARKELGRDFRRAAVRETWTKLLLGSQEMYCVRDFYAVCSSGTYMRSLANRMGGLALSITRTAIGTYQPLPLIGGIWTKKY